MRRHDLKTAAETKTEGSNKDSTASAESVVSPPNLWYYYATMDEKHRREADRLRAVADNYTESSSQTGRLFNGRVVIIVPNALSLHRLAGVAMGLLPARDAFSPGDQTLGHRRVYTRDILVADLSCAVLTPKHIAGIGVKPLSNSQMDRWDRALREAYAGMGAQIPDNACMIMSVAGQVRDEA